MRVISKYRWGFAIIIIIILISAAVSGAVITIREPYEAQVETGKVCGTIYDALSGKGIIRELAVSLRRTGVYEREICWPDHPDNPGYFEFIDVRPGRYYLAFDRSWMKIALNNPDARWIEGGWICPDSEEFEVKAGDVIELDFHFDFYAFYQTKRHIDNQRIQGTYAAIFGYGDDSILWDDSNLIGKVMTFTVSWANTIATRTDCTIEVLDEEFTSDERQYAPGTQTETLRVDINNDFLEQENWDFNWKVVARSLPSIQIQDIEVLINWTVTNPSN
jgi:hypothetical protein